MFNVTRLRILLGWLGCLLPFIVLIVYGKMPPSISATYYTNAVGVFSGILCAVGFLLISYTGYDRKDDFINTIAGILAICVILFPCNETTSEVVGTFKLNKDLSNVIHCISAVGLFALLIYNSGWLFTKHSGEMTENKKVRNVIYKSCALGMCLSLFTIPLVSTWGLEALLLIFFGISFLTKANKYRLLYCDPQFRPDYDIKKKLDKNTKVKDSNEES